MSQSNIRVWRYMSFAKLVWMLQTKQLWLSNAELLDDKWEVMLNGQQLNAIVNKRAPSISHEEAVDSVVKTVTALRKQTFINCWTASKYESHALWRIYCPSPEGIAIQTTLDRLRKSVELPVLEVRYDPYEEIALDASKLVTQKRPMFAYEQEVRMVLVHDYSDKEHPERITSGMCIPWDPELHLERIWVHPDAPHWFIETVTETVRRLAPKLSTDGSPWVVWSTMNSSPPF